MSTGKAVIGTIGTLAGLAIGATVGILYAPKKGLKTRKKIVDKGDDYMDELKSKFNKSRDSLAKKFESNKKNAEGLFDKEKAKYNDAKKDLKNAAANL